VVVHGIFPVPCVSGFASLLSGTFLIYGTQVSVCTCACIFQQCLGAEPIGLLFSWDWEESRESATCINPGDNIHVAMNIWYIHS
jgi:hypothetical protein